MEAQPIYKNGKPQPYTQTSKADPFDIAHLPTRQVAVLTSQELDKLYRQLVGTIRLVASLQGCEVTIDKRRANVVE